jgi:carboxyl-terminal processing protease
VIASAPDTTFLFLDELRRRSAERVGADPEFAYVREDMARLRDRIEKNRISINEEIRRKELADDKQRKEARKAERAERGPIVNAKAWQITLDDAKSGRKELEVVDYERERDKKYLDEESEAEEAELEKKGEKKKPEPDPIRNEAVRIMGDLIGLSNIARTASAETSKKAPPKTP